MNTNKQFSFSRRDGFTLVEVMVASGISMLVVLGLITFFISTYSYWNGVNLRMEADSDVNIAMNRLVYGMGGTDERGLRAAVMESVTVTSGNNGGWTISYDTKGAGSKTKSFTYIPKTSQKAGSLEFKRGTATKVAGRDIIAPQLPSIKKGVMTISLRVEKERGKLKASRQIETKIYLRNTRN